MFNIDSFVPFYFSATMGINILCAAFLVASGMKNKRPVFKALFAGCIIALVYQYSTWQYHEAKTLESALNWLQLQTSIIILSLPLLYFIYISWSRIAISRLWLGIFIAISIAFFGIHMASEHTLRFTGEVSLARFTIFSGEEVSRIQGKASLMISLFQAYAVVILISLMAAVASLVKRKQMIVATILSLTLVIQVAAAMVSILVDAGKLEFIMLGGLSFTILNFLACIAISRSLNTKSISLKNQITKRKNLESLLASLATGVSSTSSDDFYIQMTTELEKVCGATMVYIAIYNVENGKEYIDTKAVVANGKLQDNFRFNLKYIPQELIAYSRPILIKKDLCKRFPDIELFRTMRLESLINRPMINEEGGTEGSIVLHFTEPREDDDSLNKVLDVFTSRAAAEVKRNRLEVQLHQMAYFDYQTKLPNLTRMHELIKSTYDKNVENNTQSVLIVIDINKFTEVNRQYGFENAELAIQKLGERLLAYSSPEITIARSGGDEFTMLIHAVNENAAGLAKIHWEAVNHLIVRPITVGLRQIKLSCCAGAVVFPQQVNKHIEVMRCAETALGQAKQDKASMLRMFDESILEEIDRIQKLEKMLEHAIDNNKEIFAVYQPKVDAKGNLIGAEALARWINQELGFVSPAEFIPVAEAAGLIDKFGMWMVNTVCKQINSWRDAGFEVPSRIAINFSALQLMKADFVLNLVQIVKSHNIDPAQIEIELTESGLLTNINDCIAKLNSLRDVGFTIALDDFGTGYSSLSYLKDLPLDVLKIDRSFVNDLDTTTTKGLARSIIDIGHNMSLDIVAEGVEEREQVTTLEEMGCEIFQGYYFAKPMSSDDFLAWAKALVASTVLAEQIK